MAGRNKVVFDDLKGLLKSMERLDDEYQRLLEDTCKELAQRLIRATKQRTPVDSGVLRRGWNAGTVTKKGNMYEIEVFNDIPYSSYVEYGHRTPNHRGWVKGRFMLSISEREIEGKSQQWIEKCIKSWIEGIFNGK